MPAAPKHFRVHPSGNQMVVGKRDPVPATYLALGWTRCMPCWRRICDGGNEGGQYGEEEG
jgi:hypothetical protein